MTIAALSAPRAHAATLIVNGKAPNASDANPGTPAAPFKTIDAAAKVAKAGDTVLVAPGHYREAVTVRASGVTLQSQRPGAAIIDGADAIAPTDLLDEGNGTFSFPAPGITPNTFDPAPGNGEWVYIAGEPLRRVSERKDLAPETFFEDYVAKRIVFRGAENFSARSTLVEFARRDGLIAPAPRPINNVESFDDVTIRGFTLQHCADWFASRAAINFRGRRWLVENNTIRWCSWRGLHAQDSAHCIIRNNTIDWCGDTGISGSNNYALLVEGNRVFHSNWRRINPGFDGGFGKFALSIDCRIQNNESAYQFGFGPWFDIHNMGNVLDGNISHDSLGGAGLFSEISTDTVFQNNVSFNQRDEGLCIGESISCVARHNIVWNNGVGLRVRGNYSRRNDHASLAGENTSGYYSPGLKGFTEAVDSLPDLPRERRDEYLSKYFLYWAAPKAYPSSNNLWWENLSFNNGANYGEERDYGKPGASDPFVNNFSNFNLFFPDRRIEQNGRKTTLSDWQKDSARDEGSQLINPLTPDAKLPDWVESKRALWGAPMRSREEIDALNLGLVDSPSAAECRARFFRSPQVTRIATPSAGSNVQAWVLTIDGQRTLAVWTTNAGDRHPVRFRVGAASVETETGYGVRRQRALRHGAIELVATDVPTYVRSVGLTVVEAPLVSLSAQGFNLPDAKIPASATFSNESPIPQTLSATLSAGNDYIVAPATISRPLAPGQTLRVPLSLSPKKTNARGSATLSLQGTLGGEALARTATFLVGEGGGSIARLRTALLVDGDPVKWNALGAPTLLGTIGDASQIASGKRSEWSGPNDLSARIYGGWMRDALQLLVDVRDDTTISAPGESGLYDFDAVELFVDGRDPAFQYLKAPTPGVFQIIVAPNATGIQGPPRVQVLAKTQLQGLQSATQRTANGYTVEVKIPLSPENFPAGGFAANRPLKLSVLVDDRDNPQGARDNVLGWSFSPGGANYNDTSGWKTLLLGS